MKVLVFTSASAAPASKRSTTPRSHTHRTAAWAPRYGKAWETLDVKTLSEATTLRMRRQIELDGGWRPTTKVKERRRDAAKDKYLAEIENVASRRWTKWRCATSTCASATSR